MDKAFVLYLTGDGCTSELVYDEHWKHDNLYIVS